MEGLFRPIGGIVFGLLSLGAYAQSENPPALFHGGYENYYGGGSDGRKFRSSLDYVEVGGDLTNTTSFHTSLGDYQSYGWIDESFVRFARGSQALRIGRFRSNLGFANWSELYYTPINAIPMVRGYYTNIAPGMPLNRNDRGVEYSAGGGPLQYSVGLIDGSYDNWQLMSSSLYTGMARLQANLGSCMLGLNGVARLHGPMTGSQRLLSADFRWTAPRLQVRAEAASGFGTVDRGSGYYIDVFYRPPHLARSQLGLRVQGFTSLAYNENTSGYGPPQLDRDHGQVCTLAVRHFLSPLLAVSLNYGFGANIPEAAGARGFTLQLQSSMHF